MPYYTEEIYYSIPILTGINMTGATGFPFSVRFQDSDGNYLLVPKEDAGHLIFDLATGHISCGATFATNSWKTSAGASNAEPTPGNILYQVKYEFGSVVDYSPIFTLQLEYPYSAYVRMSTPPVSASP